MIDRRTILAAPALLAGQEKKFRVAVIGTEHGHVRGFMNAAAKRPDVEAVGPIPFEDRAKVKGEGVEAIACFTSTDRHLEVARLAAALKLPMMMEKPLATTNEDARAIAKLAADVGIPIFVNYETTWYRSHGEALFDFGCYGANLMTWMMDNQRPLRVVASVKRNKPEIYARVDDEATILVEYEGAQGIIEGSWNWPFSRKDFEVYGEKAYANAFGGNLVRRRKAGAAAEEAIVPMELAKDEADSISYLKAVARRRMKAGGLSGIENNLIATEILVAARESVRTGRMISLRG